MEAKRHFSCEKCDKKFSAKKNLHRHLREIHNVEPYISYTIECSECGEKLRNHTSLVYHLKNSHNKEMEEKYLRFRSFEEFDLWKKNNEREANSRYVKHRGEVRNGVTAVSYYYCHRDGRYQDKVGVNRKHLMKKDTNKMGSSCPSFMEVRQTKSGIKVRFFSTHVGHNELDVTDRQPDFVETVPSTSMVVPDINKDIQSKLEHLMGYLATSTFSHEDSVKINKKLDKLISLVKCSSSSSDAASYKPPNKKMKSQQISDFFSTQKKENITEATQHEAENLLQGIEQCEITIYTLYDHTY